MPQLSLSLSSSLPLSLSFNCARVYRHVSAAWCRSLVISMALITPLHPSGINLYMVPAQLATETYVQPGIDGLDILDMNTSRKLLLWAYSLLHGYCINVSHVIKYCEENAKLRIKKGLGGSSTQITPTTPAIASQAGGAKDGIGRTNEPEAHTPLPETHSSHKLAPSTSPKNDNTDNLTGDSLGGAEDKVAIAGDSEPTTGNKANLPSAPSSPPREELNSTKDA